MSTRAAAVSTALPRSRLQDVLQSGLQHAASRPVATTGVRGDAADASPPQSPQSPTQTLKSVELLRVPSADQDPDFRTQLMGVDVKNDLIEQLGGTAPVIVTFPTGEGYESTLLATNYAKRETTRMWLYVIYRDFLKKGSYNEAYLVRVSDLPANVQSSFGVLGSPANAKLLYRRSRKDIEPERYPSAEEALEEIILTAYCAKLKLHPKLHAAFITNVNDEFQNLLTLTTKCSLGIVAEAWTGNLSYGVSRRSFPPKLFAEKFVALLERTAEAGFFHMDVKPENMLYRGAYDDFELCWTDIDPGFCEVFPPALRRGEMMRCNVAIHAAQLLGVISCYKGAEVHTFYHPEIFTLLESRWQLSNVSSDTICNFFDALEAGFGAATGRQKRKGGSEEYERWYENQKTKARVAEKFRMAMHQYIQRAGDSKKVKGDERCLLVENVKTPTFFQFLEFALTRVGDPEVESWAKLREKARER
jgi:hypothetical protein